jgi:hypothetical protein
MWIARAGCSKGMTAEQRSAFATRAGCNLPPQDVF